jgi:hypothetical protein
MTQASSIPVGTQFSPDLISLPHFVSALIAHAGDRESLLAVIGSPPVRRTPLRNGGTKRTRSLPLEAAVQYGLLDRETLHPTEVTHALASLGVEEQHAAFAKHILLHCGGLRVVQGIQEMLADTKIVTGDSLARYLTSQGFPVTEHNTAINSLRMWLAKAGVFPTAGRGSSAWTPDTAVVDRLLGLGSEDIAALTLLTHEQKAFALTLARRLPAKDEWIPASVIRDATEAITGVRIDRGSLPNAVLKPLAAAGLIGFRTKGTKGGKTSELVALDAFENDCLVPFIERTSSSLDPVAALYLRKRPADIRLGLESRDKQTAGNSLEAFAIQVMRSLGLRFEAWQKRASETGWGEVDVLLSGVIGCLPTRWQVQCKNTAQPLSHEVIAREVGLLASTKATHIVILSRGARTRNANSFISDAMQKHGVPVYVLDGVLYHRVVAEPLLLPDELRRQALDLVKRGWW